MMRINQRLSRTLSPLPACSRDSHDHANAVIQSAAELKVPARILPHAFTMREKRLQLHRQCTHDADIGSCAIVGLLILRQAVFPIFQSKGPITEQTGDIGTQPREFICSRPAERVMKSENAFELGQAEQWSPITVGNSRLAEVQVVKSL
jgi:hypothetical protein